MRVLMCLCGWARSSSVITWPMFVGIECLWHNIIVFVLACEIKLDARQCDALAKGLKGYGCNRSSYMGYRGIGGIGGQADQKDKSRARA